MPILTALGQQCFVSQYEDLDNARFNFEELEREYGQNNLALTEPLSELAGLNTQHGRYEDAHRVIDRATLLIRRVEGEINGNLEPMVFLESGAGFPNIGQSSEFSMADDILLSRALFTFELPEVVDNVSRRSRMRKAPFGKPMNAKILELEGGSLDQREIFENRIQDLSFRPKLLMGTPQATEITLEYKMFSKFKN